MKRIFLFSILIALCTFMMASEPPSPSSPDIILTPRSHADGAEYTKADRKKVEELLQKAITDRKAEHPIVYFAKQFLGLPYVAHTLENGEKEHLIVNLQELDCTTFVEYVLALSICDREDERTFDDFCNNLYRIRYRHGRMKNYTDRLHYFTWWAEDNEELGIVKDIAPSINATAEEQGAFTAVQTINIDYMSKHPDLYKHLKNNPNFVTTIKKYEQYSNGQQYRYIPKANLKWSKASALGAVHDGDIIALLTDSDGLDTRHIAIAYWQGDKLYFIHASSLYKKVLINTQSLYDYELKQKKHTGIRVFRMTEGPRTAKTLPFIKKK